MDCPACGHSLQWRYVVDPEHHNRRCRGDEQTGIRRLYYCAGCGGFFLSHDGWFEYCDDDDLLAQFMAVGPETEVFDDDDEPAGFAPIAQPEVYTVLDLQTNYEGYFERMIQNVIDKKAIVRIHLHRLEEIRTEKKHRRQQLRKQERIQVLYLPFSGLEDLEDVA